MSKAGADRELNSQSKAFADPPSDDPQFDRWIRAKVFSRFEIAYALISADLAIHSHNALFGEWLCGRASADANAGSPLVQAIPELEAHLDTLQSILDGAASQYVIPQLKMWRAGTGETFAVQAEQLAPHASYLLLTVFRRSTGQEESDLDVDMLSAVQSTLRGFPPPAEGKPRSNEGASRALPMLIEQHQMALLMDGMPNGVFAVDKEAKVTMINAPALRLWNIENGDSILGRSVDDLFVKEDALSAIPALMQLEKEFLPPTVTRHLLAEAVRPDMQQFPVELLVNRIDDIEDIAFVVLVRDLQEQQHVEDRHQSNFARLKESEARLSLLTRKLVRVQEDERRRVAFDLHDDIGQRLSTLTHLMERITSRNSGDAAEALELGRETIVDILDSIRKMARSLRPHVLDDFGLLDAIHELVDGLAKQTNMQIDLSWSGLDADTRFSEQLETAAYRIVQEALNNTICHSGENRCALDICLLADQLMLTVSDEGQGFDPAQKRNAGGLGLMGMEERAHSLGGHVEFDSAPEQGACVRVSLPVSAKASA